MSFVVWMHSPILEKWPYVENVLSTLLYGQQSDMLLVCPLCGLCGLFFVAGLVPVGAQVGGTDLQSTWLPM